MFVKAINFLVVRGAAILLAAALYVYCAVQQAPALRAIQSAARWISDSLESKLTDEYAVWIPIMNLDTSLSFALFVVGGYMIVEVIETLIGLMFRKRK